jgi:hypothetical protein
LQPIQKKKERLKPTRVALGLEEDLVSMIMMKDLPRPWLQALKAKEFAKFVLMAQ